MFSVPGKTALSHLVNVPVVFANKGTFDGLAVVLAEKINEDKKREIPTLTHDKTQTISPDNIIDWLKNSASKE
ncbi:MAG: hypothetical protein IJT08_01545, partial [Alphaproteobacteria bacterium]|nr:hypothetical protein [Alphaproteobacteria bacterium]